MQKFDEFWKQHNWPDELRIMAAAIWFEASGQMMDDHSAPLLSESRSSWVSVKERPRIICLCGSTRYVREMAIISWEFEKEGNICLGLHLLPDAYWKDKPPVSDHLAEHENCKEQMDELHKRKIDVADEIFVVNICGYIGESTRSEINYAIAHNKKVRYLAEQKPVPPEDK